MGFAVSEITLDADRLAGRRRFQLRRADGEELIEIDIACHSNVARPDEPARFEPCHHPHANQGLTDPLLDLLFTMRQQPYAVDLTTSPRS
jgi:hypothetical protein